MSFKKSNVIMYKVSWSPSSIRSRSQRSLPENCYEGWALSSRSRALAFWANFWAPKACQSHPSRTFQLMIFFSNVVATGLVLLFMLGQVIGPYEQFPGDRYGGFFSSGAFGDSSKDGLTSFVMDDGDPGGLLEHPSDIARAGLRDASVTNRLGRLKDPRSQSGIVDEFFSPVESGHLADFSDQRPGNDLSDAGNRTESLERFGPLGHFSDLRFNPPFEGVPLTFIASDRVGDLPAGLVFVFGKLFSVGSEPSNGRDGIERCGAVEIVLQQDLLEGTFLADQLSGQIIASSCEGSQFPQILIGDKGSEVMVFFEQSDSKQFRQASGIAIVGLGQRRRAMPDFGGIGQVDPGGIGFGQIPEPVIEADRLDGQRKGFVQADEELFDLLDTFTPEAFF